MVGGVRTSLLGSGHEAGDTRSRLLLQDLADLAIYAVCMDDQRTDVLGSISDDHAGRVCLLDDTHLGDGQPYDRG